MTGRKPKQPAVLRVDVSIPPPGAAVQIPQAAPRARSRLILDADIAALIRKIAIAERRELTSVVEEAILTWIEVKRPSWTIKRN